jgi:hypothetical protein
MLKHDPQEDDPRLNRIIKEADAHDLPPLVVPLVK